MNNLQLTVLLNAIDKISAPVKNAAKSVNALSEQLKNSKSALRELEKVQNQMNSFSRTTEKINKSTEAINKHAKKLDNLRNKISKMKNERVDLKGQIKDAELYHSSLISKGKVAEALAVRVKIGDLTKQYEKLQGSISETGRKISKENAEWKAGRREKAKQLLQLRELKRKLKEAGIDTKHFAQQETLLAEKIKAANKTIEQQQARLAKLNAKQAAYQKYRGQVENLKEISGKAQMIGAQSMAAGATITAPLANVTKDFMNFEDAMIGVARQVPGLKDEFGNFTPEFDEWKKKIQNLSKTLPLTTVQIANMIESAARMDIPKEQLEEFVRINTQMATAFDATNPDEMVEAFGKVSKNFKLTQEQTRELADTINYLDDNTISKGTGIIGYMNRVAGIAGIAKITDKNMAALGSTLQTLGAAEEDSATAVTTIFTRLGVAGNHKEVDGALKKLRLDPKKIASGMAKDAQATLMLIVEKIKGLKDSEQTDVMKGLVGIPHIKTISKLVTNTEEWRRQIKLANSEAAKGSMAREFETRMKALSASTQIFENQLYNLKATIGGVLAPTLNSVMVKIGGIIDKVKAWIEANPELARKILIVAGAIGTTLTAFGALSLALSFVVYPIARLFLGLSKLKILLPKISASFKTVDGSILRGLLSPLKLLMFAFTPLGAVIIATVGIIAGSIYKYWTPIKAFFGGFWEGLKSGLAPVIEKFKPLGDLFGVVVGWIEKAVKWFMDLLSPVQSTQKDLDAAASAGKKFGEWVAKGIDLALTPLKLLQDGIQWVLDHMPSIEGISNALDKGNQITEQAQQIKEEGIKKAFGDGILGKTMQLLSDPNLQHWKGGLVKGYSAGGYTGNGGKYQPMGIVHGGEYVMTKEATSRLGIHTLNALNYGKQALIAGGLGVSVATAAPVQADSRPPISARPVAAQVTQPMTVQITINAAQGMDERMIAQQVAKEFQRIQNQQQARARNSLRDRG
ncbi:phage tail tape measure protein [Rodentibacter myodis]|uniref:Phage tail tape measure protein n=1 Tax=Rodentibacter myodis TaxID=1907939 RepID=A0A1V3JRB0_9PAST|nr:phage tail tape measure protein [Rodentibacter myodis]OOF59357.1 phage tail tape measure protein [Rodentibacter myodis]